MKQIAIYFSAIILSLTIIPLSSIAEAPAANTTIVNLTAAQKARVDAILLRLQEIKSMDKTNMSSSEKRSLRKEVRSLKRDMKSSEHGVYLSVGAIIIIILLLILIL